MADITGYEGIYTIDIEGNIHNNKGQLIKQHKDNRGYRMVVLLGKKYRVHRILANLFIPNTENKLTVNHIDGNKSNNNINNLEWCTQKENVQHAVKILGKDLGYRRGTLSLTAPTSKKLYQYSKQGVLIKERNCARDITRALGIGYKDISRVCYGGRPSAGGFKRSFTLL